MLSGKIGQVGGGLATKNFTYNAGSQISTIGYVYDDNGNLTNTPDAIYSYNDQDRLFSVTATDTVTGTTETVSYNYDYLGRRTSKSVGDTTTYYHYDESNKNIWRVIGENIIRPNGAVEEKLAFAYLPGDYKPFAVKQGSASYYYQYNAHGDVVALTNENGTTVAQYEYDPLNEGNGDWGRGRHGDCKFGRRAQASMHPEFRGQIPGDTILISTAICRL